jgi:hypothetical protein
MVTSARPYPGGVGGPYIVIHETGRSVKVPERVPAATHTTGWSGVTGGAPAPTHSSSAAQSALWSVTGSRSAARQCAWQEPIRLEPPMRHWPGQTHSSS